MVNKNENCYGNNEKYFLPNDVLSITSFYIGEVAAAAKSLQSCPHRCDPIDGSAPGSPIPGILQARRLEWVAIAFSDIVHKLQKNKKHRKV